MLQQLDVLMPEAGPGGAAVTFDTCFALAAQCPKLKVHWVTMSELGARRGSAQHNNAFKAAWRQVDKQVCSSSRLCWLVLVSFRLQKAMPLPCALLCLLLLQVLRLSEEQLSGGVLDDSCMTVIARGCSQLQELELVQVSCYSAPHTVIGCLGAAPVTVAACLCIAFATQLPSHMLCIIRPATGCSWTLSCLLPS
jgi:hypothetical protein